MYRESMSGYRKERIRVIEVPLPLPKPEKVWRSAFKSMNVYCQKGNETDFKKFSSSFPKLDSMPQDERTLTTSVHCELTLLLYSITSSVYCVKIGISKHCCWLCEKYIEAFQALYKKEKEIPSGRFSGKDSRRMVATARKPTYDPDQHGRFA